MKKLNGKTYGELLGPAMEITDQTKADQYFKALVDRCMELDEDRKPREEIERIQRINLGYYAGYYSHETRERVERLFRCAHPIFGSIADNGAPTPKQAFELGKRLGESAKR